MYWYFQRWVEVNDFIGSDPLALVIAVEQDTTHKWIKTQRAEGGIEPLRR